MRATRSNWRNSWLPVWSHRSGFLRTTCGRYEPCLPTADGSSLSGRRHSIDCTVCGPRHNLEQPEHQRFLTTVTDDAWWDQLPLILAETLQMQQDRRLLQTLQTLIGEADAQIHAFSIQDPWVKSMPLLLQLPGFAVLNTMTVLAAIGDIHRFPTARHGVSYAGLAASIHESGQTHRGGRITKEGCRDLRAALVEAAWMVVEHHRDWKARFERLANRIGRQKAIVAIARKLLVALWHILTYEQADRHADAQVVSRKLLAWISRTGVTPGKHRAPGTRARLLQHYLQQLGLTTEADDGGSATFQPSG